MRGRAKTILIGVVVAGLAPRPAFAVSPPLESSSTQQAPDTAPPVESPESRTDDPLTTEPAEVAPTKAPPETPVSEPAPTPEPAPAVPEPAPEPPAEPAAEAAPTTGAEPFPATEDAGPARSKRALGLGLLVAGTGFVVIGATTAGLYAGTEKRCGGSCIGGAIAAAAGVAGVVLGAIVFTRAGRRDVALHSGARTVARWRPGRGVSF